MKTEIPNRKEMGFEIRMDSHLMMVKVSLMVMGTETRLHLATQKQKEILMQKEILRETLMQMVKEMQMEKLMNLGIS